MGARNVAAAFAMYPHLRDGELRLLAFMALTTLDEPTEKMAARVSWLGRESLAGALGYQLPPEPDQDDPSDQAQADRLARASGFEMLRRRIKALSEAGAIERVRAGGRNRTSEYRLNLDALGQTQRIVAPTAQRIVAPKTQRIVAPKTQRIVAPDENRGTTQENRGGQPSAGAPPHLVAVPAVDKEGPTRDRRTLESVGPERTEAYLAAAHREGHTVTAALIRRAAELAHAAGAR